MPCQCKTDRQRSKCVYWIGPEAGIIETNDMGEKRIATGCFPLIMIRYLGFVCKTNLSVAAAVEDNRNKLYQSLQNIIPVLTALPHDLPE